MKDNIIQSAAIDPEVAAAFREWKATAPAERAEFEDWIRDDLTGRQWKALQGLIAAEATREQTSKKEIASRLKPQGNSAERRDASAESGATSAEIGKTYDVSGRTIARLHEATKRC